MPQTTTKKKPAKKTAAKKTAATTVTAKPYGISLHIGLNKIDASHYGSSYPLAACINDAKDMLKVAKQKGFDESTVLTDENGTYTAIKKQIRAAAKKLRKNDFFLITYSGHGAYVPDNNKDESDGNDETWCLYDRMIIDDELAYLWSKFRSGVRILMISDSCHSGTVSRVLKADGSFDDAPPVQKNRLIKEGPAIYKKHKSLYDNDIPESVKNLSKKNVIRASVILMSGCQDNQFSLDGIKNGLFTEKLLKVYNKGKFKGNYAGLLTAILKQMPSNQTPNYSLIGKRNIVFENGKPFEK
ncbi:MAG: caspase family protein [Niabella sp.]